MEHITPPRSRILWLDAVKFAAIIGVILDHTKGLIYNSDWISSFALYCVSLFVITAGMTSYLSNQAHQRTWWQEFLHSSKKIVLATLLAVFVYQVTDAVLNNETFHFDLETYLQHLVRFDSPLVLYYVALYLQLMLVSRFLYRCIEGFPQRFCLAWEVLIGILLLVFAAWSIQYTNIFNIYGGGGKLFGGTCLFLYYLGMLLMKHSVFEPVSRKRSLLYLAVSTPLLAVWFAVMSLTGRLLDTYFPFGYGINPTSVSLMVLAVLMLFWVYSLFTLLQPVPCMHWPIAVAAFIGQHTLYIFLYHPFFLDHLLYRITYIPFTVLVSFTVLLFFPIAWEYIVHTVCRFFRRLQRLDA